MLSPHFQTKSLLPSRNNMARNEVVHLSFRTSQEYAANNGSNPNHATFSFNQGFRDVRALSLKHFSMRRCWWNLESTLNRTTFSVKDNDGSWSTTIENGDYTEPELASALTTGLRASTHTGASPAITRSDFNVSWSSITKRFTVDWTSNAVASVEDNPLSLSMGFDEKQRNSSASFTTSVTGSNPANLILTQNVLIEFPSHELHNIRKSELETKNPCISVPVILDAFNAPVTAVSANSAPVYSISSDNRPEFEVKLYTQDKQRLPLPTNANWHLEIEFYY